MSFDRSSAGREGSRVAARYPTASTPGKRTWTEQIGAPIEGRSGDPTAEAPRPVEGVPRAAPAAAQRDAARSSLELLFGGHLGAETGPGDGPDDGPDAEQDGEAPDRVEDRAAATADPAADGRLLGGSPDPMRGAPAARAGVGAIRQLQRRAQDGDARADDADAIRAAADRGTRDGGGRLPYFDQIQRLFGRHDVAHIQAHTGARAAEAAHAVQADAFATGDHVAFAGMPSLHTAAHEAAHVVQQRGGVRLARGVGEEGDDHERHADEVADRVVRGQPAEGLLDAYAAPGGAASHAPHGAPVQLLRTRKQFLQKTVQETKQQESLSAIASAIDAYHGIKAKADRSCQQRLHVLKELDRHIYSWFSTFVVEGIAETPNGTLLRGLLDDSQEEHAKLVAIVAKDPSLLPVDTAGMSPEERDRLLVLWRSIVDGTGHLQIKGDKKFTNRMRAGLAKLLQTDTGRTLIERLNARQDSPEKTVTLGPEFKNELKALGREDPKTSEAVPSTLQTKDNKVGPMVYTEVQKSSLTGEERVEVYKGENIGPAELTDFITGLPPRTTHFEFGGRLYKLGEGVGSYVKMAGKGESHVNIGTRGQDVLTPEFVTLGHELGHSLRMLTGTTVPFREDLDKFGFKGTAIERTFWNNAEEYVNIRGVENRIRQEHGIDERMFHASDRKATQAPRVKARIDEIVGNGALKAEHPTQYDAIFKIAMAMANLNNQKAKVEAQKPTRKPGVQRPSKEEDRRAKEIEQQVAAITKQIHAILLSEETRIALDAVDQLLAKGSSAPEQTTPTVDPSPENKPGNQEGGPSPVEEHHGSSDSTSGEDPRQVLGGHGETAGTSPYEILMRHCAVKTNVPVSEKHGSDEPPGGERDRSEDVTSPEGPTHDKLWREGYWKTKQALADWLKSHGIRVVPNSGGSRNNCLIISLVQHATGNYANPAAETVDEFKNLLVLRGIDEDRALLPTDEAFKELVAAIRARSGRDLRVVYVLAFGDQEPPYALVESPIGSEPVVIWDQLGHYEALTL